MAITPSQTKSISQQISQIQAGINKVAAERGVTLQQSGGGYTATPIQQGGAVVGGRIVGAGGTDLGAANPADIQGAGSPRISPPTDVSQPSPLTSQISPSAQAPKELVQQTQQVQQGINQLAQQRGVTLQPDGKGGFVSTPNVGQGIKDSLALAKTSGQAAPDSAAVGSAIIGGNVPQPKGEEPSILGQVQGFDANFDSIFTNFDDYFSPIKQRVSLVEEYQKLSKSLGIEQLNTEIINTKRILEGTEDDIRLEIEKSGGLGTESLVMALASSRNKVLLKNYQTLLDTREAAMTQLDTLMDLTVEDRKSAEAEFDRKMNFVFKVSEFKQRASDNARQTYLSLGDKMGWDTLLGSASPYEQSLIQKSLGVSSQALSQLATTSAQQRALKGKETAMDNAIKAQQLYNLQLTGRKQEKELGIGTTPATTLSLSKAHGDIQQIDELTKSAGLEASVGTSFLTRKPTGLFGGLGALLSVIGIPSLVGGTYRSLTGQRQDFIAGVEQLRSNLNLDALVQAKSEGATFGALSDNELRVLANAATKLGSFAILKDGITIGYNANERGFRRELDRINYYAKLDYVLKGGAPEDVGAIEKPDKTLWVKDSFGNLQQLQ